VKAIRVHEFGGPEVLKLEEVPDVQPGPEQVLVRVRAAGVNPVDTYIRSGSYAMKPALPYTPGQDAAGDVVAIGSSVKKVKIGDRVYTSGSLTGTYAELTLCAEGQVHPLPPNVSYEQGAAIGTPAGTAYRGLIQRGEAKAAETVMIHGASGSVGNSALQLALASGMTVIGTAGTERGLKSLLEEGAHHAVDHSSDSHYDEVMKLTEGRGVDVILEMLANKNLAKDLTVLAKKGRAVVIGNRGTIEINPRDAMSREADIRGVTLVAASDQERKAIYAALTAALEKGTLRPVIGQQLALAEAAKAHEEIMKPSGVHGKIVLIP
jgi:NADPH2:quinone reductase